MKSKTSKRIVKELFQNCDNLLFKWHNSRCKPIIDLENRDKRPIYVKDLSKIWQEYSSYNEYNTVNLFQ
jgi:hypothetical protein